MAFTPATLGVIVQPIGGGGMRFVSYRSDDSIATVAGTDYFTGGESYGLRLHDLIFVSPVSGTVEPYILVVTAVDSEGNVTATQTAFDADLTALAGLDKSDGNIIVGDGSTWVAESGATARTSLGLGSAAVKNTGTSGDAVPLLGGANTWSGAQTVSVSSATPLSVSRTGSSTNTSVAFTNTSGTVYAGHGAANTFAIDGDSNLAASPWFSVSATAITAAATSAAGLGFFIDEDDMASDSATKVPSQQSVKAYADAIFNDLSTREYWVEDFGAVGDGTTDDRDAINTAISTISAAGGGVLRFKAKTYIIERGDDSAVGVIFKSNVMLVGSGMFNTIIKAKTGTGTMHLAGTTGTGTTNVGLYHLTFDGNGAYVASVSSGSHTIRVSDINGFFVSFVCVKNSDHHGIATLTPDSVLERVNENIYISNVYLENIGCGGWMGGDGLRIFYGMRNVVIENVVGYGIEYHGIHIAYGACNVNNVVLFNVGNAAISAQSDGCLVSNVHVEWEADHLICDLLANRPAAGTFGRHFRASDTAEMYYDNGVEWKLAASNPYGLWTITRSGGFPTGGKSSYSNIKIVMNMTENETWSLAGSDGVRFDTPNCQASNIQVYGKFRFGVYTTEDDITLTNVVVDGCREDAFRLSSERVSLSQWKVVTASMASAGTSYAVRIAGTHCKVQNGYALDATNIATAIAEVSPADYSIISGNHLEGSSYKLLMIGANSKHYGNTGLSYEYTDISNSVSPADTATNVLKTRTIESDELRHGQTIRVQGFGTVSGTNNTKTIRAFVGTNYFTIASEAAGDTQDWGFTARITRFSSTGYIVEVSYFEEGGTAAVVGGRYTISGDFAVGMDVTLANGSDAVTATALIVKSE